jgi:signal transduction histidine kinase/DNA-binding response OmpR family regulator
MSEVISGMDKTNILVVDDLPEKRLAYEALLEGLGQNVVAVGSGMDALKEVLQRDFAVILLDVNMPEMDGFETARLIRGRKRSGGTPIIFLTAFADEVRTSEGYATGAVDYIPTPVVPAILLAKVRVFVELFQMRREVAQQAAERARHAAAAEANRRLSFLADAGSILGRSLDFEATARDVVRLPVPFLAEISVLYGTSAGCVPWKDLVATESTAGEPAVRELTDADELPYGLRAAAQRVLQTGEREWIRGEFISQDTIPICHGVAIPLQARGRTFAVLAMSHGQRNHSFDSQDISMVTALSSRAAIALDNALLHEELRRRDRQRNDFLSMLAHELRNPLAPISNAVQLLSLPGSSEKGLHWACEVIDRQVRQMVRLVDDLLDISRITHGKIRLQHEPIELPTIMAHAVEASRPLIDARRHQLAVSLPPLPLWVSGDRTRLAQVITNLLNNAAKYMAEGGQIWLSARQEGGQAILSVRDMGIGIPPHMLSEVFELFSQVNQSLDRSQGGLGIGLTLVRQLVELHGGQVTAASPGVGLGSEFTVRLPVLEVQQSPDPRPREFSAPYQPSTKILVVDDNGDSADSLAKLLRLSGHKVQVAYDGPSGLEAAQTLLPDVVLLDIGLPGMDGYAVAQRLRELESMKETLLIAISGYSPEKTDSRSRLAGFDQHFVKPVNLRDLQTLLATLQPSADPA